MLKLVKERLQSFGYELREGDNALLVFAVQKAENTIKNDCNVAGVPEGLLNIAVDMAESFCAGGFDRFGFGGGGQANSSRRYNGSV